MNPIFLGDSAFFRAFGRGFYLGNGRSRRSAYSDYRRAIRRIKRCAKASECALKPFMRDLVDSGGTDHKHARKWLSKHRASR